MKFYNLPDSLLNTVIGESYDFPRSKETSWGEYTVKDELSTLQEDIIYSNYRPDFQFISHLVFYTKTYVATFIAGPFEDLVLIKLKRNPSEEIIYD